MKRCATSIGALLVSLVLVGCAPSDPMTGRAGSDLPPGPLQPLPSDTSAPPATCETLEASKGGSEGAAGSQYVQLRFKNTSDKPCFIRGYPSLTLRDGSNHQVGESARSYVSGGAKDLVIDPGDTVLADVRFPNPDNFEAGACKTGTVKLEILIPGAKERTSVADNHAYCPGWSVSALHRSWG